MKMSGVFFLSDRTLFIRQVLSQATARILRVAFLLIFNFTKLPHFISLLKIKL